MRILLTGANGFIGKYLLAHLRGAGHQVVPAVRNPQESPAATDETPLAVDFNHDISPDDWLPRLKGIDAVINCAGVLQESRGQSINAIHSLAPRALFSACQQAGVRRVVQISAISAEAAAGTAYAATKLQADEFLKTCDLDWVIVRPSLIYAAGAFGGTAMLRALAALPCVLPLAGKGDQVFQPIHISDVARCISRILADSTLRKIVIDPVGPHTMTLRDLLLSLRAWLGYRRVPVIEVPLPVIRALARMGDVFGGTLNTTALRQLEFGNCGDVVAFTHVTGIRPLQWADALQAEPSQWQDRWHARLFFLRPALRCVLALLWLASGLIGVLQPVLHSTVATMGLPVQWGSLLALLACVADIAIGVALLWRWKPQIMAAVQLGMIGAYTLFLSFALPGLWLDPFGPLLKNLPLMAAVLVLAALEQDR